MKKCSLFNPKILCTAICMISSGPVASIELEEVIVTATHREVNIQDVPISVSAVSGDTIEQLGVSNVMELFQYVPNLKVSRAAEGVNVRVNIRGIGSLGGNTAFEPSVATYIDGVYIPKTTSLLSHFLDIERVEVLRGPQGTLFGRNAAVGAISIVTKKPTQEFEGYVSLGTDEYGSKDIKGAISGGLTENLTGRVAALLSDRASFFENEGPGSDPGEQEDRIIQARLLWAPSDELEVNLSADYQNVWTNGVPSEPDVENYDIFPDFEDRVEAAFGRGFDRGNNWKANYPNFEDTEYDHWGVSMEVRYDINEHTLISLTSYRDYELDSKNISFGRYPGVALYGKSHDQTDKSFSQEFRILSPAGETLEYVAGLFYFEEEVRINPSRNFSRDYCEWRFTGASSDLLPECLGAIEEGQYFGTPATVHADVYGFDLQSYAAYGQLTWNIREDISVTGGLRYTTETKDNGFSGRSINFAGSDAALRRLQPLFRLNPIPADRTFFIDGVEVEGESTDYFANLSWHVTEDVMLFMTTATGYKSPGIALSAPDWYSCVNRPECEEVTFDEEESTNYEIGIKGDFFDNRLRLNASAFHLTVEGFQERSFDDATGGFDIVNAEEMLSKGVELDSMFRATDALTLTATVAYLDNRYTDWKNGPALPGGTGNQDLTGRPRFNSPQWTVGLGFDWRAPMRAVDSMEWSFGGEYQYTDEHFQKTPLPVGSLQESYEIVNLRASVFNVDNDWQVTLAVHNVFEEYYCQQRSAHIFEAAFGGRINGETTAYTCNPGRPRTTSLRFNKNF